MADLAITAEKLSKKYRVSALGAGYKTWREGVNDIALAPLKAISSMSRRSPESAAARTESKNVWAVRDVSFEVKFGEALGIVGHNGAGKSTLVKILSRITEPTSGRAEVAGRVGSLLEVSAGFHPELTGRENVYLNGAVLGMSRADIRRRFDEIVSFAGVERYLDTPVKYYSSGMSMRLAFAVAVHLEPEVLVVDEVLAVGDSGFHKQCLDKMTQAVDDGRTVIFISHNLAAVTHLCCRGLLLDHGRVAGYGSASEVVAQYLSTGKVAEGRSTIRADEGKLDSDLRFTSVSVSPPGKEPSGQIDRDDGVEVVIEYEVARAVADCQINLELWNYNGICVLSSGIRDRDPLSRQVQQPGPHSVSCQIPSDYFRAGLYSIGLEAFVPNVRVLDQISPALSFEIIDLTPPEARFQETANGAIRPVLRWSDVTTANRSDVA
jgi:lipopolysaccharide transport system ATP-binding protein